MIDLSIIIVSYNTQDILLECLDEISKSQIDKSTIELIIVDNASVDRSLEMIQEFINAHKDLKIKVIKNMQNVGFGAANNRGIRIAKGRFLLLLNSDVLINSNTLCNQLDFMNRNPEYAASTCKLLLPNGKMDPACHRGFPTVWASITYFAKLEALFPGTKLFGQYHQGWKNVDKIHKIDAISGAFFMVKREVLEEIGLFDEGFFMYGEDLDLCLRLKQTGRLIGFNATNTATHLKGQSGRKKNAKIKRGISHKTNYHFYNAMILFYEKHYEKKYPKLVTFLVKMILRKKTGTYDK